MKTILKRIKKWLQSLSPRTGAIVLILCLPCYLISFIQMLFPLNIETKSILWTIFFGLAKTFQYAGITILGAEGYRRLKKHIKPKWYRRNK
ncbi:MAG: hypothetical protein Q4F47_02770 [Bacteroidaceae bacterium]|nr:hypothetical protein [Bacteroidaceae bacterium]MDO5481958.1 hypothetical protein [Bacteroidaceae bacterium]